MLVKFYVSKMQLMLRSVSINEDILFWRLYKRYHDRDTYKNKKYLNEQLKSWRMDIELFCQIYCVTNLFATSEVISMRIKNRIVWQDILIYEHRKSAHKVEDYINNFIKRYETWFFKKVNSRFLQFMNNNIRGTGWVSGFHDWLIIGSIKDEW